MSLDVVAPVGAPGPSGPITATLPTRLEPAAAADAVPVGRNPTVYRLPHFVNSRQPEERDQWEQGGKTKSQHPDGVKPPVQPRPLAAAVGKRNIVNYLQVGGRVQVFPCQPWRRFRQPLKGGPSHPAKQVGDGQNPDRQGAESTLAIVIEDPGWFAAGVVHVSILSLRQPSRIV